VPPTDRIVPRYIAEPPQEGLPYGRWAERLSREFLAACLRVESEDDDDLGEPQDEITWFPDRTFAGRTYVPATARTTTGWELFGYVAFTRDDDGEAGDFEAGAEATDVLAEENPDWKIDLSDVEIGTWHGRDGKVAAMTLVWGVPQVNAGAVATAELGGTAENTKVTVDQCALDNGRFTLIAPDRYPYDDDVIEVRLFDRRGRELARESLYEDEDEAEAETGSDEETETSG
jgi:hypothetical protein